MVKRVATSNAVDLLLTVDTTGSMYPCLTQVRRNASALVRRMLKDVPNLRIAIIAHGDYCDARSSYVTKHFDFSSNVEDICRFINGVGPTGGGDAPECYELVLHEARTLQWRAGAAKVAVLIGDDEPHPANYPGNVKKIDWRNELKLLVEAGIKVCAVHAMPGIRSRSKKFYEEVAKVTGGYYLTLDQFAAVTDLILAVCYKQGGGTQLEDFLSEVRSAKRMSRNMASVAETLTGKREKVAAGTGLAPVPSGRFQVIEVDADEPIKQFVTSQGLEFKKGRGFYEFTKTETIQENKEIVLVDKASGDMYSGDTARELIGLPKGVRGRLKPAKLDQFAVFVQSTSVNRNLKGGTRFLYEVSEA